MTVRQMKGMAVVGTLFLASVTAWAQRGQGWGMRGAADGGGACAIQIDSLPKQALDSTETAGLLYLREEEKLARDVYAQLCARWGSQVFVRISQAEQRHADAVKTLLDRYGLADPAADKAVGVFTERGLQTLYGDLVKKGDSSLAAAFRVGATIEDLDIRELDKAMAGTDNQDFKVVCQNLENASRYHLRAFNAQLSALNESYTAQYITPALLKEILSSAPGNGRGCGGRGNGSGACVVAGGTCPYGNTPGTASRRP
jgi:hypothetical protein